MMQEVIKIIEELKLVSGNEQLNLLMSHKDNELLREVLLYTYDNSKVYKISDAKLETALNEYRRQVKLSEVIIYQNTSKASWLSFKTYLDTFSNKKGVKENEILEFVSKFYDVYKHDQLDYLFKGVLLKSLDINMGIKSFQKVWPDFCFTWPYMGCRPQNDKNLSNIKFPAYAQTKMDGAYCNVVVKFGKKVEYVSRQGKPIAIQGSLDNILLGLYIGEDFVLNGEILVMGPDGKVLDRSTSNGIIRRDSKTQEELDSIVYRIWDIIPYKDFITGKFDVSYERRLNALKVIAENSSDRIQVVDTYIVNSLDEAMELFEQKYSEGEEGIVLKNMSGIWKNGKGPDQVKVKSEKDCDLQMIEFTEGKGAYAGMCGTIRCISQDRKLEVSIKPRTPQIAQEIWNNTDMYLDKIVAVKYNEKIKSPDKDTWSLFLPVFIEVRDDKSIADKFEDIK